MSVPLKELDAIIRKAVYKSGLHRTMEVGDAAQEIWLRIVERWPGWVEQVPRALLYWFAYRRAQDIKRAMNPCSAEVPVEPASLSETIVSLADDPEPTAELRLKVKEIFALLNDRERDILYALYAEGKSQSSVAEDNDISRTRVQQIEKAAVEKMRREWERAPPPSSRRTSTCTPSSPPPSSPPSSRF